MSSRPLTPDPTPAEPAECLRPPSQLDATSAADTCASTNNSDSAKLKCDDAGADEVAGAGKLLEYDYEEEQYQEEAGEAAADQEKPAEPTPPPIATFDEWAKEKLQEKQRKVLQVRRVYGSVLGSVMGQICPTSIPESQCPKGP